MKKAIISFLIASGLVGSYWWYKHDKSDSNNVDTQINEAKWEKKAPQLFNNAAYADLKESAPSSKDMPESWIVLSGTITNPFGIRDDILEYILANVPESNVRDTRALIKKMQYAQEIYYGNPTESEAMLLSSKEGLALTCFSGDLSISSKLNEFLWDTSARDKHIWEVDRKYFSWKVLGTGLSDADEKTACREGRF